MSYHTYYTDAFVLGRYMSGEWDSRVVFLTRDLGLVTALVKGYKRPASKLRAHLSLFARVKLGLVRGKETWRVIFVQSDGSIENIIKIKSKRLVVAKFFSVIKRLIKGEYSNPEVFEEINLLVNHLKSSTDSVEELDYVELVGVFRILHHLGYAPSEPNLKIFLQPSANLIGSSLSFETRGLLVNTINESLKASHL